MGSGAGEDIVPETSVSTTTRTNPETVVGGSRSTRRAAEAMIGLDILVALGAPLWNYYFKQVDIPLQLGAAVIAVATFFGVWLLQRNEAAGRASRNSMRDAIAAAFVVTYLVIVGWSAFFNYLTDVTQQSALSPLTSSLITNFTALTGVVVGSYFGADALKQITQINAMKDREQAAKKSGGDATTDS
jgi:predicted MFS family arabinose efflux permease